jgi:hypothetical protein
MADEELKLSNDADPRLKAHAKRDKAPIIAAPIQDQDFDDPRMQNAIAEGVAFVSEMEGLNGPAVNNSDEVVERNGYLVDKGSGAIVGRADKGDYQRGRNALEQILQRYK